MCVSEVVVSCTVTVLFKQKQRKELKKVLFNKAVKVLNIFSAWCWQENSSMWVADDFVGKEVQEETLDPHKHYQRSSR